MAVKRIGFDDVLAQLDAALALCDDLGLGGHARRSRFAGYRRTIVAAIDRVHAGVPAPDGLDAQQDAVAFIESLLLGEVVPFLRTCPSDVVASKLAVVLDGPTLPSAESATSNRARNFMFELSLGFRLWRAGLAPVLGDHPDLICVVNGTPVLVECKRPLSDEKVSKRIKEGRDQVLADLKRGAAGARRPGGRRALRKLRRRSLLALAVDDDVGLLVEESDEAGDLRSLGQRCRQRPRQVLERFAAGFD